MSDDDRLRDVADDRGFDIGAVLPGGGAPEIAISLASGELRLTSFGADVLDSASVKPAPFYR